MKHRLVFAGIALFGASLDLASKHWAFRDLREGEELVVLPGFFELCKTLNRGIVFGIAPEASRVFLWVSILAVPAIAAIFLSLKKPHWVMTASLGLILGGTIGNMVDRVRQGAVRDFIKFYYPNLADWAFRGEVLRWKPWPVFNIADSCICVGVVLLTLEMFFFDEKKKKKRPDPAAPSVSSLATEPITRIPDAPADGGPAPDPAPPPARPDPSPPPA